MPGVWELRGSITTNGGERLAEAWLVDGVFTTTRPDRSADRTLTGWFYPGFVDVHCHIGLGPEGMVDRDVTLAQAHDDLAAGALLVRDAGVPSDTHWLDDRTDVPVIIRAGRHIARPKRYLRHFPVDVREQRDLPAEMARQARAGDGWVKIVGDWIDRSRGRDAVVAPLWEPEALKDGIAAAHEAGARVTVHTFSTEAIEPLLDAGIDCVEHGSGMLAEHIQEAARRGIPVTPTLVQSENFLGFAEAGQEKYPAYADQMRWLYDRREHLVRDLVDAGVQILPGSDAGGTLPHGTLPNELALWRRAGIDPQAVLDLSTWQARAYLASGPGSAANRAGDTGLVEGKPADAVYFEADPAALFGSAGMKPDLCVRGGNETGGRLSQTAP